MRRKIGITDGDLQTNEAYKKAYAMAKALPLLPANDLAAGIDIVQETAGIMDARMSRFLNYLRQTWLPSKMLLAILC